MAPDDDDPKVKQLLESEPTQADLERWFSLPSFQQVEEEKKPEQPAIDPDIQAVIDRRAKALEHVDPAFVEAVHLRTDQNPRDLIHFKPSLEVHIDENFGTFDEGMVSKVAAITDPRIYGLPEDLQDDMRDCAPQALLRDLHRPEQEFEKRFDLVDVVGEQRLDAVAEVASAMKTSWKLPAIVHPHAEAREVLAALRVAHRRSWVEYLPHLQNRRVRE